MYGNPRGDPPRFLKQVTPTALRLNSYPRAKASLLIVKCKEHLVLKQKCVTLEFKRTFP